MQTTTTTTQTGLFDAKADFRRKAHARLDRYVADGKAGAHGVVSAIMSQVPTDRVVKATAVEYIPAGNRIEARLGTVENGTDPLTQRIHSHAIGQIASRLSIPMQYVHSLTAQGEWGMDLLAKNLNTLGAHDNGRLLMRSVDGEIRGALTDKYRRLDTRPILEGILTEAKAVGAVPVQGTVLDTKTSLKIILPRVIDVDGDLMVFGLDFSNSDYGDGALSLTAFLLRLICANGAVAERALRQVHLGARLGEDITYSQRTYQLDTQTTVSATKDLTKALLAPARAEDMVAAIRTAQKEGIDAKAVLTTMRTKGKITKGEEARLCEIYNTPDVEMLPGGNNKWRFSNALSFLAHEEGMDPRRALDFERMAGDILVAK